MVAARREAALLTVSRCRGTVVLGYDYVPAGKGACSQEAFRISDYVVFSFFCSRGSLPFFPSSLDPAESRNPPIRPTKLHIHQ